MSTAATDATAVTGNARANANANASAIATATDCTAAATATVTATTTATAQATCMNGFASVYVQTIMTTCGGTDFSWFSAVRI